MNLRIREEISAFIKRYTVPIYLCSNDTTTSSSTIRNGSGVLVQVKARPFIFTAGHCADEWLKLRCDHVVIAITPSIMSLHVINKDFRYVEAKEDFGYFALDPADMKKLESLSKELLPEDRLSMLLQPRGHQAVISGFPKPIATQPHLNHTAMIGKVSDAQDYKNPPLFKVGISNDELQRTVGTTVDFEIAGSGGMSGGGCWLTGNVSGEGWSTEEINLLGTHFYADKRQSSGQLKFEMSVSKHLEMIARKKT